MPDPFDDARRSLDEVPAPDLWDEAQRRAADGSVVPLSAGGAGRRRRPGRWLAVAAAAALAGGTVAMLVDDDDQSVDTTPRSTTPRSDDVAMYQESEGDCAFGVTGEPLDVTTRLSGPFTDVADGTNIEGSLGDQTFRIDVPGQLVIDLVGERVEEVELTRGTAQVWFGADFVQVRWFTGSPEPCESFTVTVAGGTEDGNRHAAVDLADRILLSSELDGPFLRQTEWQLERSTVDGVPTDGNGSTFTFRQNDVLWSDGCNDFSVTFDQGYPGVLDLLGDIGSTKVACPANPTSEAIATVMTADQTTSQPPAPGGPSTIHVTYEGEFLILTAGDVVLTLRPIDGGGATTTTSTADPAAGPDEGYAIWPITQPGQSTDFGDLAVPLGTTEETAVSFAKSFLGWRDAVVTDREPSEDGRDGGVYLVTSEEVGGAVLVWAASGSGDDGNVVYHLDSPDRQSDPDATASVSVQGQTGMANVAPAPAGTVSTSVSFSYGTYLSEGSPGSPVDLYRNLDIPGAVIVLFRNADGTPISAWATPLRAGDFAAE